MCHVTFGVNFFRQFLHKVLLGLRDSVGKIDVSTAWTLVHLLSLLRLLRCALVSLTVFCTEAVCVTVGLTLGYW